MAQDVLPTFLKHINRFCSKKGDNRKIDILILSYGGDPIISWRIISLLREKFKKISVLIPYTAFSAATLLALGADEIIMHPYGNLGPVDPQISMRRNNEYITISYEDITKYIEFVKDIGITDQEFLQRSFDKLTTEILPTTLGLAKRSSQLGLSMGEKLLSTHMEDKSKAKAISETLNAKFYHHSYPLGRSEAKEIGLPVSNADTELDNLMWSICEDFLEEMKIDQIFDPYNIILEEISKKGIPEPNTYKYVKEGFKLACLESFELNSCVGGEMFATYVMKDDMSLTYNVNIINGSWKTCEGGQK